MAADWRYHHEPLRGHHSIRLFTLQPSWIPSAPLQGQLEDVNLNSAPAFEAISYVCGRPGKHAKVSIAATPGHGYGAPRLLEVTSNCHAVLIALRWRVVPRTLWIDSVCIDEDSQAEKSRQVALMSAIYGAAKQVVVYLGLDGHDPGKMRQTRALMIWVGANMQTMRIFKTNFKTYRKLVGGKAEFS